MKETSDFLAALGHERFTAQTFPDNGLELPPLVQHGPLSSLERRLRELNKHGAGIYFMVNRGDLRGRRSKNVIGISSYFADLDGAPLLSSYPLEPTIIVESSKGRYHLYWRIIGAPKETFSHVQEHVAVLLGGDEKVKDLPRVMRLPGFYHMKAEPYLSRVLSLKPQNIYEHGDFLTYFAVPPAPAPLPPAARAYLDKKPQYNNGYDNRGTLLDRVAMAPSGQRNDTLFRIAAALANDVKIGKLEQDVMVEEAVAAAMAAGLSEHEARQTAMSALRYGNGEKSVN